MDDDVLILARLARLLERACTDLDPPLTLAQYRLLAMIGDSRRMRVADLASERKDSSSDPRLAQGRFVEELPTNDSGK